MLGDFLNNYKIRLINWSNSPANLLKYLIFVKSYTNLLNIYKIVLFFKD